MKYTVMQMMDIMTTAIQVRMNPKFKKEVQKIPDAIGLDMSGTINISFELRLGVTRPSHVAAPGVPAQSFPRRATKRGGTATLRRRKIFGAASRAPRPFHSRAW